MSSERDIEKLLRQTAEKRRAEAGAPFELHPADRRLLQGEVRQRWPRADRARSPSRFFPRLAWSFGLLTALVIGGFLLFPEPGGDQSPMALASKEESAASRVDRLAAIPAPAAPPAPIAAPPTDAFAPAATATVASETLRTGNPASRPAAESSLATARAPAPAGVPTGETGVAGFAGGGGGGGGWGAGPARQNAETTLLTSDSTLRSRSFAASSAAVEATMTQRAQDYQSKLKVAAAVQNYNRAIPVAQKRGAGSGGALVASEVVLNRFQVANQDNLVSVVDADGSVYEGTLKEVVAESKAETQKRDLSAALPPRAEALAAAQNQVPVSQLYFEVAGTNISLGQKIVFTATVLPAASNALQVQNYFQNAPVLKDKALNQAQNQLQNQILLQNSQLRGRVQLPQGQEFELEAVPTPP